MQLQLRAPLQFEDVALVMPTKQELAGEEAHVGLNTQTSKWRVPLGTSINTFNKLYMNPLFKV